MKQTDTKEKRQVKLVKEWKIQTQMGSWIVLADTPLPIAVIHNKYRRTEINKANAELMAQAPTLKNTLAFILNKCHDILNKDTHTDLTVRECKNYFGAIAETIQKVI